MKTFKVYSNDDFKFKFINTINGAIFSFLNPFSCLKFNHENNIDEIIFGVDSYYLANFFLKINYISFDNSSFAPFFFEYCLKYNKKILFIGAKIHENNLFINNLKANYIGLYADGINGYMNTQNYINYLFDHKYDYVVIGMGTPLQENLANILFLHFPSVKFLTCGGYIRQASIGLDYFPHFFIKFRVKFLYRFYKEPHVLKRTFYSYFKFFTKYFYGKYKFIRIQ